MVLDLWTYRRNEVRDLLVAWFVLSFAFSAGALFDPGYFLNIFALSLVTVGLGYILHELAHKFTARRYGAIAEFRLWTWGLMLALLLALASGGRIIFAAPGAVYIMPLAQPLYGSYRSIRRETGLVALSGPLTNAVLAIFFFSLSLLGGFFHLVGLWGCDVNLWLASFNMLPLLYLDGWKVFSWSRAIWALITAPLWMFTLAFLIYV